MIAVGLSLDGEIMRVDHALHFGGFNDGVEVCYHIGDLYHIGFDRFPLWVKVVGSVRGLQAFIEAVQEFAEAFGTMWVISISLPVSCKPLTASPDLHIS